MKSIHDYFESIQIIHYKSIAIYGIGKTQQQILKELRRYQIRNIYLTDRIESKKIGETSEGLLIHRLDDIIDDIDAIVIASYNFHMAIGARLVRETKGKNIKLLDPFKMISRYPSDQLVINKYLQTNAEFRDEEELVHWHQDKRKMTYKERIDAFIVEAMQEMPLFNRVEIETFNRCNGVCSFCPVNKHDDTRPPLFMEEHIFKKIIKELEDLDYSNRIALYSNNEPLLDPRIFDFSKYMREHLPNARIHMFTNGTLFTLEKFLQLIPFLDELIIDNYTEDLSLIKPVQEIKDFCEKNTEYINKVSIVLRKPHELLSTRGGDAPNRKLKRESKDCSCTLPFQQLVIRPTGEVSLCCNDPLGKYTMGDLSQETIMDVWHGEKYNHLRKLLAHGREHVEHCRYCDFYTIFK